MTTDERKIIDEIFQVLVKYNITNKNARELLDVTQYRLNTNCSMFVGDQLKGRDSYNATLISDLIHKWEDSTVGCITDYKCNNELDTLSIAAKIVVSESSI